MAIPCLGLGLCMTILLPLRSPQLLLQLQLHHLRKHELISQCGILFNMFMLDIGHNNMGILLPPRSPQLLLQLHHLRKHELISQCGIPFNMVILDIGHTAMGIPFPITGNLQLHHLPKHELISQCGILFMLLHIGHISMGILLPPRSPQLLLQLHHLRKHELISQCGIPFNMVILDIGHTAMGIPFPITGNLQLHHLRKQELISQCGILFMLLHIGHISMGILLPPRSPHLLLQLQLHHLRKHELISQCGIPFNMVGLDIGHTAMGIPFPITGNLQLHHLRKHELISQCGILFMLLHIGHISMGILLPPRSPQLLLQLHHLPKHELISQCGIPFNMVGLDIGHTAMGIPFPITGNLQLHHLRKHELISQCGILFMLLHIGQISMGILLPPRSPQLLQLQLHHLQKPELISQCGIHFNRVMLNIGQISMGIPFPILRAQHFLLKPLPQLHLPSQALISCGILMTIPCLILGSPTLGKQGLHQVPQLQLVQQLNLP
ncbi:uncharacterized protein [Hoplias malabaricus]|uniref:uncharacterized protein isoform X2 n=1 Tax=Hoplias malabaricus TaxID=27720 RepID=UPI003463787E